MNVVLLQKNGETVQIQGIIDTVHDRGVPVATRAIFQDITEKKEVEKTLKELEYKLVQAQKMESVGRLAGGVAHDYNNISSIIIGYAELSMDEVNTDDSIYANLEEILFAARRAAEITAQLLAFARKQTVAPEVIDINSTVNTMLKMLRRLIGENVELRFLPGDTIWPVKNGPYSNRPDFSKSLC